jgi:hypothetical protein
MAENQMRGYGLLSAVTYLRKMAGEQRAKQILDGLSPETKQAIAAAKEASWCSSKSIAEVYRAIASLSNGDEGAAQKSLIDCGKYAAQEASNTFLRLLMKLLTPTMFAKKLPDLWSRDCTVGKIVTEVHNDRIRNRLVDMTGFDHIAPVAVGYVAFALEAMGKSITKMELHGWSLATPSPSDCWFEVFWKT